MALLVVNIRHYNLAIWGFCKLDPDYPLEFRVFPNHITDAVFEYRTYFFLLPWALILASAWPQWVCTILVACWLIASWTRAAYFKSGLAFWRQAASESPNKFRCLTRCAEELIKEIERKYKRQGETWSVVMPELAEAAAICDRIVQLGELKK